MPGEDNEPAAEAKGEENKDKENRVPLQLSAGTIVKSRFSLPICIPLRLRLDKTITITISTSLLWVVS